MSVRIVVIILLLQGWMLGSVNFTNPQTQAILSQDGSWSDDFQDGNFDDWDVRDYFNGNYSYEGPGNFSIINGALTAQAPEWNYAIHDSTVAYGSENDIIMEIERILELADGRPNVLLGTGAVPYETPSENILFIKEYVS